MKKILERWPLPKREGMMDAEIVLCHFPDNECLTYVTWQRNIADGSFYAGHYFDNRQDALNDYHERVRKSLSVAVRD